MISFVVKVRAVRVCTVGHLKMPLL